MATGESAERVQIDKEVVKVALREILEEIPSFRSMSRRNRDDVTPGQGTTVAILIHDTQCRTANRILIHPKSREAISMTYLTRDPLLASKPTGNSIRRIRSNSLLWIQPCARLSRTAHNRREPSRWALSPLRYHRNWQRRF